MWRLRRRLQLRLQLSDPSLEAVHCFQFRGPHLGQAVAQEIQPFAHALAARGGNADDANFRIDPAGVADGRVHIEIEVRQQVDLVQQHEARGAEHVGVFDRFVFALGHGQNRHLVRFPQIKGRRADQIADVFDQQQRILGQAQLFHRVSDHVCVEMAATAGVDLDCRGARGTNAFGILTGLLVAFDDGHRLSVEHCYGLAQQRSFARTGAGNQIQGEDTALGQTLTVLRGVGVVLGQNILLDLHHALGAETGRVGMPLGIGVAVLFPMSVIVRMLCGVGMLVAMARSVGMHVFMPLMRKRTVDRHFTRTTAAACTHALS